MTNASPFYILFGREPNTHLDALFKNPLEEPEKINPEDQSIKDKIKVAHEFARKNLARAVKRAGIGYKEWWLCYTVGTVSLAIHTSSQKRIWQEVYAILEWSVDSGKGTQSPDLLVDA